MKNKKNTRNLIKAAIAITITLTFIIPSSSSLINTDNRATNNINVSYSKSFSDDAQKMEIERVEIAPGDGFSYGKNGDSIILTDWCNGDSYLPSITMDDAGHTVVTWTNEVNETISNMGISYSDDPSNPLSWIGRTLEFVEYTKYWDTAWIEGPEPNDYKGLYGVYLIRNINTQVEEYGDYFIEDITTHSYYWDFWAWDGWPGHLVDDLKYACVADNSWYRVFKDGAYFYGPFSMYIAHLIIQTYDIPQGPACRFVDVANLRGITFIDEQAKELTSPGSDPDMVNLEDCFHTVLQYTNETTGPHIVWKKINTDIEPDYADTPWQETIADGTNPAIAAYELVYYNNVVIVYMNEGEVKCIYSDSDGAIWSTSTIATGVYPDIYAMGTRFYCTYINNGNLYLVYSSDGGETWSTPTQVNDNDGTVVEEENSVDIHEGGIVWTDNRNGRKDLFYVESDFTSNHFIRGDAKADGEITIGDAMHILKHLYVPGWPEPTCLDTVDVNDDGNITMDDAVYLMRHLYIPNAPQPPEPFPNCGPDPTPDDINCISHLCNDY